MEGRLIGRSGPADKAGINVMKASSLVGFHKWRPSPVALAVITDMVCSLVNFTPHLRIGRTKTSTGETHKVTIIDDELQKKWVFEMIDQLGVFPGSIVLPPTFRHI